MTTIYTLMEDAGRVRLLLVSCEVDGRYEKI